MKHENIDTYFESEFEKRTCIASIHSHHIQSSTQIFRSRKALSDFTSPFFDDLSTYGKMADTPVFFDRHSMPFESKSPVSVIEQNDRFYKEVRIS